MSGCVSSARLPHMHDEMDWNIQKHARKHTHSRARAHTHPDLKIIHQFFPSSRSKEAADPFIPACSKSPERDSHKQGHLALVPGREAARPRPNPAQRQRTRASLCRQKAEAGPGRRPPPAPGTKNHNHLRKGCDYARRR